MYIIELATKLFNKYYRKKTVIKSFPTPDTQEPEEKCEHVFRPVDSTGLVLACIKCGFVVNMNDNQNEDIL